MKHNSRPCIESQVAGIPCLIQIDTYVNVKPWKGSAHTCDNSDDFYGYTDIEFTVLDRKGYKAAWLEKKLTAADKKRIEQEIINHN